MDYVALDLETTGLSPQRGYIIEIGAIKMIDGKVKSTYETFVQCPISIDSRIQELTGITDEMVKTGKRERQAIQELLGFVGDSVLLGHNISFDYGFVKAAVLRQGLEYEALGIDTLGIARKVLPDLEKRSLEYLCAYYKIETKGSHRALADAAAAAKLYQILQREFGEYKNLFVPTEIKIKLPKIEPITNAQKRYLKDLLNYHQLTLPIPMEQLSKSEASRKIDEIIREHGKIQKFR